MPSDGIGYAKAQIRAILWRLAQVGARPSTILAAVVLWLFCDQDGATNVSHRRLAEFGLSVRAVQDALAWLRAHRYLASAVVGDPDSAKRLATEHVLALPTDERALMAPLHELPTLAPDETLRRQLRLPFPEWDGPEEWQHDAPELSFAVAYVAPFDTSEVPPANPAGEAPTPELKPLSESVTARAREPQHPDPIDPPEDAPAVAVAVPELSREDCDAIARAQARLEQRRRDLGILPGSRAREAYLAGRKRPILAAAVAELPFPVDVDLPARTERIRIAIDAANRKAPDRTQLGGRQPDRTHGRACRCRLCEHRRRRI